jgi:hypothetical protein
MSRLCVSALLLLLLIFAALPAAGAPRSLGTALAQPTAPNPELMGMSIRDPWYEFNTNPDFPDAPNQAFQDQMGATLALAGVRWVRMEFHISVGLTSTETISAEIKKNDYFIKEVAPRHGLKILGLLGFDLLRGTEATLLNTEPFTVTSKYGGGVNAYMDTWLTRALMIADHYRDYIAAYQILNEQNRLPPSGAAITPQIMGRLQTKFYRFCKNINPANENHGCTNAQIIMGGIHPRGTSGGLNDADYLKAIYNDSSFKDFYQTNRYYPNDGVAYHPYPQEIIIRLSDVHIDHGLQRMRAALEAIVPPGPPLPDDQKPGCQQFWITEVGYNVGFDPDGPKNPTPAQTDQGQADFMRDVYTSLAERQLNPQLGCTSQAEIAHIFWFKYEDFPPAEIIKDANGNPLVYPQKWGIVRIPILSDGVCEGGCYAPSGVPLFYRQSFWAYRELAGLPVYRTYMPVIGVGASN